MSEMTARRPQQLRSGDPMMTRKGCEYFPKTPGRGSRTLRMTRQQTLGTSAQTFSTGKGPHIVRAEVRSTVLCAYALGARDG